MLGSRLASVSVALVVRHVATRDQDGLLNLFCGTSVQKAHDACLIPEGQCHPDGALSAGGCFDSLCDRAACCTCPESSSLGSGIELLVDRGNDQQP